ncbi:hypothetical protein [Cerasicoccus maritimus]|uniref:hypothetical protein n=1 Tax=Cerasicoccus maritimus TaxID=490089 RepID=UPI00285271B9|nr:hypothetical protein [Cerasicoccus maritimus]
MPKRPTKKKTKPASKSTGWTPEQIAGALEARDKFSQATPGAVLDALYPEGMKIGNRAVIPLTIASYTFLERIGNPITDPATAKDKMDNLRLMELCFVLTRSVAESREIWAEGTEAWEDAVFAFGENLPLEATQELGFKIGAIIKQATATVINSRPPGNQEAASKKKLASAPQQEMGSAGSSRS